MNKERISIAARKTAEIALKYGVPLTALAVSVLALKHGVFQHVQVPFAGHTEGQLGNNCIPQPYGLYGNPLPPADPTCHYVDSIQYTDKIGQGLFGLTALGGGGTALGFGIADVVKFLKR
ncbi:MAG TPA: hypothetical protein VF189_01620 [Patescibacteria group bacterium]